MNPGFVKNMKYFSTSFLLAILFVCGCSRAVQKDLKDANYYFERGMKQIEKKDYARAVESFQTIVESHASSGLVDKAQFMLAEAHYLNEDYITAEYEYERVYMDFPSSQHAAEAWYKKAMCLYNESPKANLDSENTLKAIDEYNRFLENFPYHELVSDAKGKIGELREKLAYKDYLNAEQYRKMKAYDAAIIYYDSVISNYPQSVWIEFCQFGKGIIYMKLMKMELKLLKRINKSENPDLLRVEKVTEEALKQFNLAKTMFSIVVNSETYPNLKKKASKFITKLDEIKELK
ncbi:outer membrane protein assembly factor BamD [Candidatus Latescibacterota bacterium]